MNGFTLLFSVRGVRTKVSETLLLPEGGESDTIAKFQYTYKSNPMSRRKYLPSKLSMSATL